MPRGQRKLPALAALSSSTCERPRVAAHRCTNAEAQQLLQAASQSASWGACKVLDLPLYVGSHADALQVCELQAHGITGIINIAVECENPRGTVQADSSKLEPTAGGISVLRLNLQDHSDAPITQWFLPAAEFAARVWEQGGAVLVHCRNGISRAPTVTTAILMLKRGMDYNMACAAVQAARPQASPNLGFVLALQAFAEGGAKEFRRFAATQSRGTKLSVLLRRYRFQCAQDVASANSENQTLGATVPYSTVASCAIEAMLEEPRGSISASYAGPSVSG